jgi:hypothetical protein
MFPPCNQSSFEVQLTKMTLEAVDEFYYPRGKVVCLGVTTGQKGIWVEGVKN